MNTVMPPNRRLDEIFGYIKKLSPDQLTELIRTNPNSTEATLALGLVNSQNDFRDRVQGQQGDMPTVKDGILGVGVNQNNADMRMDGIAAVPMEPQNSSVVPMSGVAGIPAREMTMTAAQGGLIGFAGEGDSLVEDPVTIYSGNPPEQKEGFMSAISDYVGPQGSIIGGDENSFFDYTNPLDYSMLIPAGAGIGLGYKAAKFAASKAKPAYQRYRQSLGRKELDKLGGTFPKGGGFRTTSPGKAPTRLKQGNSPKKPSKNTNETATAFTKRMNAYKLKKAKYDQKVKDANKDFKQRQTAYNKRVKDAKDATEASKYEAIKKLGNKKIKGAAIPTALTGAGIYGLTRAVGKGVDNLPENGYSVERADGEGEGAGAVAGTVAGTGKDKDKGSYVADALIAGGLGYASGKNIGESGIIGLEYANKRRSSMSDKEKLAYDRETQTKVAQIKANNALERSKQLTNANRMKFADVVTEFTTDAQNGLPRQKKMLKAQYGDDITGILTELGVDIAQYQLQAEGRDPEAFLDSVIDQALTEKFKANYIAQTGIRSPTGSS